jgi:hypothetical protein
MRLHEPPKINSDAGERCQRYFSGFDLAGGEIPSDISVINVPRQCWKCQKPLMKLQIAKGTESCRRLHRTHWLDEPRADNVKCEP